jgi:hypothetical protein
MKTVQLFKETEKVTVKNPQNQFQEIDIDFDTVSLLRQTLNFCPKDGYFSDDLLFRVKILHKLDSVKADDTELLLEDADYNALAKIVKDTKWNILSKSIGKFLTQFIKD